MQGDKTNLAINEPTSRYRYKILHRQNDITTRLCDSHHWGQSIVRTLVAKVIK